MKLEVGCGSKKPRPGYVGCDIRKFPHVKFVCPAWEIDRHVKPQSVSHIYSRHTFEHFTYHDAGRTLMAWRKIMQPGAELEMIVPDMIFHIHQMLNPNRKTTITPGMKITDEQWAINSFFGWQRDTDKGLVWDVHKSGYDFDLLKDKLNEFGFVDVKRIDDEPKNLHVSAINP